MIVKPVTANRLNPLRNITRQQRISKNLLAKTLQANGVPKATSKRWVNNYLEHLVKQGNTVGDAIYRASQSVISGSHMLIFSLVNKTNPWLKKIKP